VLDILLAQPQTAEHLTRKLWGEFVSPTPDEREVRRIASRLRGSGYDLRLALGELLRSPAFWAAENRQALVKSPVDYVVGSFNSLAMEPPDTAALAGLLRQLGQDLFAPPNVKGWPGGEPGSTAAPCWRANRWPSACCAGKGAKTCARYCSIRHGN
jgi:uncharacterized protein (DUF1800 family)